MQRSPGRSLRGSERVRGLADAELAECVEHDEGMGQGQRPLKGREWDQERDKTIDGGEPRGFEIGAYERIAAPATIRVSSRSCQGVGRNDLQPC